MLRLTNVAEQAGRYSSTLKQMLHGIEGYCEPGNEQADGSAAAAGTGANGESIVDAKSADGARASGIMGAIDPSLGESEAKDGNDDSARTDVDGGPDRIPAFLLPFVGLPTDPHNLGPQTGNSYWNEALLDRPLVGVPVAYPVGFGQAILNHSDQHNGSAWASEQQQGEADNGGASGLPTGAEAHSQAQERQTPVLERRVSRVRGRRVVGSVQPVRAACGRELGTEMPDRPMSFSQHYNHQNPAAATRPRRRPTARMCRTRWRARTSSSKPRPARTRPKTVWPTPCRAKVRSTP